MVQKRYLKTKDIYKTTFRLPKEVANGAETVQLLGEFNKWGEQTTQKMKKLKSGEFKAVIELPEGEYEYKYLLDNERWENDNEADKYVGAPFGGENSVVCVTE